MSVSGQPVWAPARVTESRDVAAGIRRITLARPATRQAAPGSHLDVRVRIGDHEDTRSYSVVDSSADGGLLTIAVQLAATSRGGSAYLHTLVEGDELPTTQPLQNFPLRIGAPRYVLLAGGIGITAIAEMARVLASLGADYHLVYVARSREVMAYAEDLTALHRDRISLRVDDEGNPLDVPALVASVASHALGASTELYMCGPIRLMDAVRRAWLTAELPVTNLRYETFGNSGWFDPEPFVVRLPELGIETTVGTDTTVLDALTEAGADLMYDCRKGECGLCLVTVTAVRGRLDHRDVFLSSRQQDSGSRVCLCVSRAVSLPDAGAAVLELSLP